MAPIEYSVPWMSHWEKCVRDDAAQPTAGDSVQPFLRRVPLVELHHHRSSQRIYLMHRLVSRLNLAED